MPSFSALRRMLRAASVPGAFLGKIAGEEVAHPFSQNVHEDSYHRLLRQRNAAWRFQKRVQTASHVEELNTGAKEIGGSLQHHSGPKKAAPLAAQYTDLHVPRLPRLLVMLMLQLNSRIGIALSLSLCLPCHPQGSRYARARNGRPEYLEAQRERRTSVIRRAHPTGQELTSTTTFRAARPSTR